jgi:methylated-DNA-[protein]-cysteine S-methyltransferase
MTIIETAELASPIGPLVIAVRDGRVCAVDFATRWSRRVRALEKRFGALELRRVPDPAGIVGRLTAYFAGDRAALADVALDAGGTAFQRKVWTALRRIPLGRTVSYRDLAHAIGAPRAVRAVGAANGANPIAVVVPCHRVIQADGGLGGYAGGLDGKRWLLRHESGLIGRSAA